MQKKILFCFIAGVLLFWACPHETFCWWFSKSNEEKIIGTWQTTYDFVLANESRVTKLRNLDGEQKELLRKLEKALKKVVQKEKMDKQQITLTFHKKGQISSGGRLCGWYSFTGENTLKYERRTELELYYFTIEFPSDNLMIWYKDDKKWKSFQRIEN